MCQGSQIYILVTGGKLMFLLQGLVLVNLLSGFVLRKCIFVAKYVKKDSSNLTLATGRIYFAILRETGPINTV